MNPVINIEPFNMAKYPNEDKATPACLDYIRQQLQECGARFDLGGFEMHDLHTDKKLYTMVASGHKYSGGIDGAVTPYGLIVSSASPTGVRVAIELKHPKSDKQQYEVERPDEFSQAASTPPAQPLTYSGSVKRQVMMELVAANVYSQHPVYMLLCGGKDVNVLLHLRGEQLWVWKTASWGAIIKRLADWLKQCSADLGLKSMDENGNKLPGCALAEELLRPLKKCRELLPPKGATLEAFESVMSFAESDAERRELTAQLLRCAPLANDFHLLPPHIQHMFG